MQVHQFVPGMAVGDAVTNHALEIQGILRRWNISSEIYSVPRHVSPHMKPLCRDYREHRGRTRQEDIAVYHFSIGSELSDYFRALPDKKVMIYHNITPQKFFNTVSLQKAKAVEEGRQQLRDLAPVPDLALGVSDFNRRELEQAGYRRTGVFPLVVNEKKWDTPANRAILNRYRDNAVNILFVGRMAPNKRIEDVIQFFYVYQKTIRPCSRLLLVGSQTGMEKYYAYLKALCQELDLRDVVFTGHITDEDLNTYYRVADLYVCMSEHEGFCMPLLEAMHFGVPVMAYDAAAIAETLGGAGVLVKEKNYQILAEMAERMINDIALREKFLEKQKERLADFSLEKTEERLKNYLESLRS